MDSSPKPHQPLQSNTVISIKKKKNNKKKKNPIVESSDQDSIQDSWGHKGGGFNVSSKYRNPRKGSSSVNQNDVVGALALPTGMAIAAVLSQVLEQKDAAEDRMSVDHLSKIFTLAVGESLSNVFGNKYDCFVHNFEKSFRSTLMTLRLVNESSQNDRGEFLRESETGKYCSDPTSCRNLNREESSACHTCEKFLRSEAVLNTINNQEERNTSEEKTVYIQEEPNTPEENDVNMQPNLMSRALSLHDGRINQQLTYISNNVPSYMDGMMQNTLERSIMEQSRSNDLKTFEIGLIMKKMQLKEAQLTLNSDSNFLERFKLSMGISKASFKAEKFETELKDARHAELLKTCIDCLVAGLLIMVVALAYGTYVYSHQRLIEATASCDSVPESKSWWIPKPVSSISSGLHILRCQVQVVFRMLFGVLMILSVTYLLLQRSGTSKQAMPVTFILLLLGVGCGFAGKFCIDTLGGSGNHWLFFWEAQCLLHFLSNICTPALFIMLNGRITVTERSRSRRVCPFWIRRFLFYSTILVVLPLLCGFIPFAGLGEWRDHFSSLILDRY
ncbi:Nuclear transcription factor Y subunit B-3-like [Heracleum sosnowskyi]|uniref:Nuclear transcription factor Y subunit B-3-like n=1 Tax=Heracleum sosnowskyi TaxID=360622 RepID=A0AAD8H8S3_9APIA|nr:Nuclear transcription factor Y subunit B-3-like [Heracleum sosnowskyi]